VQTGAVDGSGLMVDDLEIKSNQQFAPNLLDVFALKNTRRNKTQLKIHTGMQYK